MAAAIFLVKYLCIETLEEGPLKTSLSELLDKIDEENAEYMFTLLQTAVEVFMSKKLISQEVQNINGVVPCIRRQCAVDFLDGMCEDFEAMKNFKPEFNASEAVGITVEEAEKLLKSIRKKSLLRFEHSLQASKKDIETCALKEQPLLAEPDMETVLQDMVKESVHAVYYKELKAAVWGEVETRVWQFIPLVPPESMATEEECNEANRLKQLVSQEGAEAVQKRFQAKLAENKAKLTLTDLQEKIFEAIFAKKHYWDIVKEELKKSASAPKPEAEKTAGTIGKSALKNQWSPLRKRKIDCISQNNHPVLVDSVKNVHKDQSLGQVVSLECYVLQLPTQDEYSDGSLGGFSCTVGGEGAVAELVLGDNDSTPIILEAIEEEAKNCQEGETVVLTLKDLRVDQYKNNGRIKKIVQNDSMSLVKVKGKQTFPGVQVEDALLTPLPKLADAQYQPVIVQGSFCKVQERQTAKNTGKVFKNFAIVDKHGNYVLCLAMGEDAVQNVEDSDASPNGIVQICFAVARPAKPNPQYPNENGKLWIFKNTLIFQIGTSPAPLPATREVQIRSAK